MTVRAIASGSDGNCILVQSKSTKILVDCGLSAKQIELGLASVDVEPSQIAAILVTHEHSDHVKGVGVMSRRHKIPVYATLGSWQYMLKNCGKFVHINHIDYDVPFHVNDIEINPFEIPHDALQPCGFRFEDDASSLAVATDIGCMDEHTFSRISGCDSVLLESNFDVGMLHNGPYPYVLKQRILGKYGHLSNDEAAAICARLITIGTSRILLGHLSGTNNSSDICYATTLACLKRAGIKPGVDCVLKVAQRSTVSDEI